MTLAALGLTAGVTGMAPNAMVERFVVGSDIADKFDVIEGRRLNDKPLSRAEAYRLARSRALSASAVPSSASEPAKAPAPDNLAREPVAPAPSPAPKPKLNAPVVMRDGDTTKAQMARVNAASVSPELFRVDGWSMGGGGSGFSWNGQLVSGKKHSDICEMRGSAVSTEIERQHGSLAITSLAFWRLQAASAFSSSGRSLRLPLSTSVNSSTSVHRPPFKVVHDGLALGIEP